MNNFGGVVGRMCSNAGYQIVKNWPKVGTGIGISGFFISGIWAVRSTAKAIKKIHQDSEEKHGDPEAYTVKEAVKSGWPYYVAPVGLSIFSTACIVSSTKESLRRNAALAALYSFTENQLHEYVAKTEEIVGKRKAKEIEQAVAEEDAKEAPKTPPKATTVIFGSGKFPWYDPIAKEKFVCNKTTIDNVVNKLNHRMINGMEPYVSFDDWCDELGIARLANRMGELIGWDASRLIELDDYPYTEADSEGEPMRVIKFVYGHEPRYKYDDLHK